MVFEQSWRGILTNACNIRCEKFGCKLNWSLLDFGLPKLDGLAFCALVAELVKKCSHGFWAILVGNSHKCIQNEVSKVWLQKELIFVGFWLSQFGGLAFCALIEKLVKKWSHGFWAILGGNSHKCIQNEVSKVWLQKELIFVVFLLSQVGWICFLCPCSKICEKVE